MASANCTVTFDDGREFNCLVDSFEVSYEPGGAVESSVGNIYYQPYSQSVSITGRILNYKYEEEPNEVTKDYVDKQNEEKDMSKSLDEYEKEQELDSRYDGDKLARRYNELSLGEDDRLLRAHGIVNLDGTLTQKGKAFVLNLVFNTHRDEVVEALVDIENSEEEQIGFAISGCRYARCMAGYLHVARRNGAVSGLFKATGLVLD